MNADEYYGKKMSPGVSATILTPASPLELENLSHVELIGRVLAAREIAREACQNAYLLESLGEHLETISALESARLQIRSLESDRDLAVEKLTEVQEKLTNAFVHISNNRTMESTANTVLHAKIALQEAIDALRA